MLRPFLQRGRVSGVRDVGLGGREELGRLRDLHHGAIVAKGLRVC